MGGRTRLSIGCLSEGERGRLGDSRNVSYFYFILFYHLKNSFFFLLYDLLNLLTKVHGMQMEVFILTECVRDNRQIPEVFSHPFFVKINNQLSLGGLTMVKKQNL